MRLKRWWRGRHRCLVCGHRRKGHPPTLHGRFEHPTDWVGSWWTNSDEGAAPITRSGFEMAMAAARFEDDVHAAMLAGVRTGSVVFVAPDAEYAALVMREAQRRITQTGVQYLDPPAPPDRLDELRG